MPRADGTYAGSVPDLAPPLIAWYRVNARDLPWRAEGFGAWGVLVSEFMLQQTQVSRVIPQLSASVARFSDAVQSCIEKKSQNMHKSTRQKRQHDLKYFRI